MSASELPKGWCSTSLGILKWGSGGTPRSGIAEYYNGDIPWLVIGDLKNGVVSDSQSKITPAGLANSSAKWVEPGSVLIAMYGSIGKLGIAGRRLTTNQAIAFTKPPPGIEASYLFWFLAARQNDLVRLGKGGTQQNISQTVLKSFPFLLAPTNEQSRIVAEIERQLTRLDAGVTALKRVQAKLKRYRASVLKAACEGRLVPTEAELARHEKRDYEPADKLLTHIIKERRARWEADQLAKMRAAGKLPKDDRWKAKYAEPEGLTEDQKPQLPEGWTWTTLGQAFRVGVGATPSRAEPSFWKGAIPWVSSGEVSFCRIRATRETITEKGLANSSTEIHPKGTVLLGMIGEGKTRGQVAILEIAACNNQNSAAIRVSEAGLPPEYVYRYLERLYEQTRRGGSGNNQPALNKSKVEAMPIPLPPLAEQRRIVLEVERLLSNVDSIESFVASNVARASQMRQSILRHAFDGLLVHQDPSDEPASKILEHISVAVENRPSPKQGRAKQTTAVSKMKATR
jgi:type I restriction enzyme S subunit